MEVRKAGRKEEGSERGVIFLWPFPIGIPC